ncbi:MAG: DoxX family protein [Methylobacterium mesophilicum]|nr:DoxX family protein [Methylobacterium mesophilicum]
MFDRLSLYSPQALALLRIVAALLFIEHGTQKLFGFPVAADAAAAAGSLSGLMMLAGILEVFGGLLILVGFLTRPVAFVLSGFMAVAYFMAHFPKSFFPVLNGGDAAILFCFLYLYLFFAGPGAWAVDTRRSTAV